MPLQGANPTPSFGGFGLSLVREPVQAPAQSIQGPLGHSGHQAASERIAERPEFRKVIDAATKPGAAFRAMLSWVTLLSINPT